MLASLSGVKAACSHNKPCCFVNTLLFMKQCCAFPYGSPTSLSNGNYTCSAKQGKKAGTDILPWALERPHTGSVPGKWVGGWPTGTPAR